MQDTGMFWFMPQEASLRHREEVFEPGGEKVGKVEASFEWKEVDGVMAKVKRNLRPLLRFLSLQGTPANTVFLETLAVIT